jgi:hypothetical protein
MKTKDLVYIGIIGYLAYLLLKKKQTPTNETTATTSVPVGNASNGGLNLGTNMDLPNLTPTPQNGLPTEDALGSSNVTPLIKNDNEPTQIFGNVQLPSPYLGSSIVNPNPLDVLPVTQNPSSPLLAEPILSEDVINEIINECGKSFSIANYDKEGSYTNYWFDGDTFYTQTTSPYIKTIPTKISKEAFVEGCKKFQLVKMQNEDNKR